MFSCGSSYPLQDVPWQQSRMPEMPIEPSFSLYKKLSLCILFPRPWIFLMEFCCQSERLFPRAWCLVVSLYIVASLTMLVLSLYWEDTQQWWWKNVFLLSPLYRKNQMVRHNTRNNHFSLHDFCLLPNNNNNMSLKSHEIETSHLPPSL